MYDVEQLFNCIKRTERPEKSVKMASNSSKNNSTLPVSDHHSPSRSDEKLSKGSGMSRRGIYAAISYMSCAVLLVLFNKAALSSYSFPSANVITLLQMISSSSFLYALCRWRLISFHAGESFTSSDNSSKLVPVKTLIQTLPLALTYLLYMIVSMESVRGVNVPMYTTLRRTTVAFTMLVEYILAGQKYTSSIIASVSMIVLGAFVAGARDLSFDSYGYAVVFVSNISTAIYLATISRIGKSSGLNSFGLMWCNGIICGPILFFWTFFRGDLEMAMNFPYIHSPGFLIVLLLSCILAFFLNYSIFLNTTLNSAVTQTICGNLKGVAFTPTGVDSPFGAEFINLHHSFKLVSMVFTFDLFTITLGWIFFGGLPFDLLNIIGQLLGFLGSGLYAYFKLTGN